MASKFKVKKNLTIPMIKFVEGEAVYVRIDSEMFVGKELKKQSETSKKKEPATLCNVTNLDTGEQAQIILHSMVKSIFEDEYPNASYVGKGFEIIKGEKKLGAGGNSYNKFSVQEIELPEAEAPKASGKAK